MSSAVNDLYLAAMLGRDHARIAEGRDWAKSALPGPLDGFDREVWRRAGADGVLGLHHSPDLGGLGWNPVEALMFYEGVGESAGDMGIVFALASQLFATQTALSKGATDAQAHQWLPDLISGERIACFAMSEPQAGSDTQSTTTTALETAPGRYRLNGHKAWVTLGPVADVCLVFASTDPQRGSWGMTAFLVDLGLDGVSRSGPVDKMGLRSCPFGELRFDNVEVTDADIVGTLGAGQRIFSTAVETERAFLYAAQLGRMQCLLDRSIDRARTRQQFGKTIGSFQAVSHRIANMKLQLESSRLLMYKAAITYAEGGAMTLASALAKLQVSEGAVDAAIDAMRTFGAEGYTTDAGIEADVRDALAGLAYSGTSDIQRNIVARLLGVERPVRTRS